MLSKAAIACKTGNNRSLIWSVGLFCKLHLYLSEEVGLSGVRLKGSVCWGVGVNPCCAGNKKAPRGMGVFSLDVQSA
jgi:hypothetical protein